MIFVQLTRHEAEHGPLPAVCIRCGAAAFVWQTKRLRQKRIEVLAVYYGAFPALLLLATFMLLTWQPGNDELLEMVTWFTILAGMLANIFAPWFASPGLLVRLPFCERHHLHWFKHTLYDLLCPLFLLSLLVGCFVVPGLQTLLLRLMGLHLLQWLVVKTVARHRALQANDITDQHITLRGVHPSFQEPLYQLRQATRAAEAETRRASSAGSSSSQAPIGAFPS